MPFGLKPQCVLCQSTTATLYKRNEKEEIICHVCLTTKNDGETIKLEEEEEATTRTVGESSKGNESSGDKVDNDEVHEETGGDGIGQTTGQVVLRKSTRARANKQRSNQTQTKSSTPKGKGRRIIFKKSATKAPTAVATIVTKGSVFHKGIYYQIGDVVSVIDVQGGIYYAQIRGLLQDQYCEKSAVITWLLPTETSPEPETGFDPSTYIIGPEEDIPRKLDCMEFVCHAPSEYFKAKNSPYPTLPQKPELGFIWTRLRPRIRPLHGKEDSIFEL